MKKYTMLNLIDEVLSSTNEPLSYRQIWGKSLDMGLDKKWSTRGVAPEATVSGTLTREDSNPNSKYLLVHKSPKKYTMKKQTDIAPQTISKHAKIIESLERYLSKNEKLSCYLKDLNPQDSWFCPHVIGVSYPILKHKNSNFVLDDFSQHKSVKFFAFSIEESLSPTNLRESFFKAVSNSSWADESFLVCQTFDKIDDMETFCDNLRALSKAYNISIIKLDKGGELFTHIPAQKLHADWDTINQLCEYAREINDFIGEIGEKTEEVYQKLLKPN